MQIPASKIKQGTSVGDIKTWQENIFIGWLILRRTNTEIIWRLSSFIGGRIPYVAPLCIISGRSRHMKRTTVTPKSRFIAYEIIQSPWKDLNLQRWGENGLKLTTLTTQPRISLKYLKHLRTKKQSFELSTWNRSVGKSKDVKIAKNESFITQFTNQFIP
jgi:hypothetical protein